MDQLHCAWSNDWKLAVTRADVDAIVVCIPPHLHAEITTATLQAGKHVLCEKPLCRTRRKSPLPVAPIGFSSVGLTTQIRALMPGWARCAMPCHSGARSVVRSRFDRGRYENKIKVRLFLRRQAGTGRTVEMTPYSTDRSQCRRASR
jgi:hypothetical protein